MSHFSLRTSMNFLLIFSNFIYVFLWHKCLKQIEINISKVGKLTIQIIKICSYRLKIFYELFAVFVFWTRIIWIFFSIELFGWDEIIKLFIIVRMSWHGKIFHPTFETVSSKQLSLWKMKKNSLVGKDDTCTFMARNFKYSHLSMYLMVHSHLQSVVYTSTNLWPM